jgi:Chaperone of endosialidase
VFGDNATTRIGSGQSRAFIAGIRGATTGVANAVNVVIDSNGQLGTVNSSRRFKQDIQDMGDASANLMRLRPITYRYQQPYADGSKPADYGLIAEEVAEVYPDLVVKGADGQVETVQYQKLTPMLLNEVQRQHAVIQDLQRRLATLEAALLSLSGKP